MLAGYTGEGVCLGQFFQKFAAKMMPAAARPPLLAVTAFGKHPGWDDHMDDAGHQFPEMLTFKHLFYVRGIGGNIDSGAWAHLPESRRLNEFNHLLIYSAEDYYILAAVSASRDGKGRSLYPLVTAVQARRYSLSDLVESVGPVVLKLRDTVRAATAVAAVRTAVQAAQLKLDQLTGTLPLADGKPDQFLTGTKMVRALAADNPATNGAGRIIYSLQKAVENCGRQGATGRTETLRLPMDGVVPWDCARIWIASLRSVLGANCPLMAIEYRPPTGPLLADLIIGPAGPGHLFCLRAGSERIPLATEIPYELDGAFQQRVSDYIAKCRSAPDASAPPLPI